MASDSNIERTVSGSFRKALQMMKSAGYGIGDNVSVVVDPKLPFMGYTFPNGNRFTIVASGSAVDSRMLEGLLVHEMSHIYRMKSNHPSHEPKIINEEIEKIARRGFDHDYQLKILHDIVNSLEDLYADDIAFKVFGKSNMFPVETAGRFFMSWLTPEPVSSGNKTRDGWVNAAILLRNSFALSNMTRHRIPDIGDHAKHLNEKFLSRLPNNMSDAFKYFHNLMTGLRENVAKEEFRSLLHDYLEKFVEAARPPSQSDPTA